MAIWDKFLSERDKQVFNLGEFAKARIGWGKRPALLIIDCNYNFCGNQKEDILESLKKYPLSCGEDAWAAVEQTEPLLRLARTKHIPVIFSNVDMMTPQPPGWRNMKSSRRSEIYKTPQTNDIVRELAPLPGETVLFKMRPSVFHGTPFLSLLNSLEIDTLIVCGTTTSGCVRATVVDAYSYGYRVVVVEECTFDRGQASHAINLFDMNAKYADVLPVREVIAHINTL
jgi:nicotinamidase-related amidase